MQQRIHDDNPDAAGRGDRRAIRKAPSCGDVVNGCGCRPKADINEELEGPSADDLERFGGVTRECPECGKECYDESSLCYHCGHAFMRTAPGSPSKNKTWVVVTVALLIGLFLAGAFGGVF